MTLVLIWLALSVVLGACVCRLLALSGPGNPEKYWIFGKFFRGSAVTAPANSLTHCSSSGSLAMFAAICVSHFVFRLAEDVTGLQKSS